MSSVNPSRRRFLWLAGCGIAAGGAGYTYARGIRFPLMHFVDTDPVTSWQQGGVKVLARGAFFQGMQESVFRFRAFVPEPAFEIRGVATRAEVVVENIHRDAGLETTHVSVDEDQDNLTRRLAFEGSSGGPITVNWQFPNSVQYRFAAIGDSGGGSELEWVMKRASQLGADFLVHMGDIYYQAGDLDRAAVNLNRADIPTFAAIGNHDFHKGLRAIYPKFNRLIGPSNSAFTLGGIEFVNLDTAADFVPAVRGRRARIIESLKTVGPGRAIRDRVAFTHKPLADPDTERDHDVDRTVEADWLRDNLLSHGTTHLLAGHIHIKEEFDDQGLYTYISGQGLAHADLIVDKPYAEILIGDVDPGAPVRYRWEPLNMPFEAHCNERNLEVLDALKRPKVKARLIEQCGKT